MFEKTRIEKGLYWDRLWRIVDGCNPCSPGCRSCWSARYTHRFDRKKKMGVTGSIADPSTVGWVEYGPHEFTGITPSGSIGFNGKIRLRHDNLDLPLRTKKAQAWLILNDLFHESVPFEFIESALGNMAISPRHIFLVLTKRPKRMLDLYQFWEEKYPGYKTGQGVNCPNIWLGVTVCNQEEADKKIPLLRQIPAGVRFISVEPLLEQTDLCLSPGFEISAPFTHGIHWVIIGGETGPRARPMMPQWALSVKDQCVATGIPFFFKKHGSYYKLGKATSRLLDGREWNELPEVK